MHKAKIIIVVFLLFAVSAAFSRNVFAQEKSGSPKPATSSKANAAPPQQLPSRSQLRFVWDYSKELGLSKDQLDQMGSAWDNFQKSIIQLKAKYSLSEIDLQELVNKHEDLKLIEAQVEKSAAIEGEMRFAEIKMNLTVLGLLTAEQRTKWQKILAGMQSGQNSGK